MNADARNRMPRKFFQQKVFKLKAICLETETFLLDFILAKLSNLKTGKESFNTALYNPIVPHIQSHFNILPFVSIFFAVFHIQTGV